MVATGATGSGGVDVVTGADIANQILDYQYKLASLNLQAQGQQLSHSAAMAGIGAQNASTAASLQANLAATAQRAQEAAQRYDVDLKNYGLSVAQLNYNQRMGQLKGELDIVGTGLQAVQQRTATAMANYQQRQGVADTKLKILDMLNSRKGPSNYVAYNSLLNQLTPGQPGGGQTTIDPFKSLTEGLYQPVSDALPAWAAAVNPSAAGINQPAAVEGAKASTAPPAAPAAPTPTAPPGNTTFVDTVEGTSRTPQQQPTRPQGDTSVFAGANVVPATTPTRGGPGDFSGFPSDSPLLPRNAGDRALITTGGAGPSNAADWSGFAVSDPTTGQTYTGEIPGGRPVWVQRMAAGGIATPHPTAGKAREMLANPPHGKALSPAQERFFQGLAHGWQPSRMAKGGTKKAGPGGDAIGPVVVGDSPDGAPTGNEELAMVKNPGADTQLQVQPANPAGMAAQAGGGGGDDMDALENALQGILAMVENMKGEMGEPDNAEGEGGADTGASSGAACSDCGGVGVDHSGMPCPSCGGSGEVPSMAGAVAPHAAVGGTFPAPPYDGAPARWPTGRFPATPSGREDVSRAPERSSAGPNRPVDHIGKAMDHIAKLAQMAQNSPNRPLPHMAAGGTVGTSGGLQRFDNPGLELAGGTMGTGEPGTQAWDTYNAGNTQPTFQISKYTPQQLGNLPFIGKLWGENTSPPAFQGWGSTVGNPDVGVASAPSLLNLQRYGRLLPSEQDMADSLLSQGLGLDTRDVLEKSQRAAPGTINPFYRHRLVGYVGH